MWIQISSGRGPAECERAVYLFWYKYLLFLIDEERGCFEVLNKSEGSHIRCLKSILVSLNVSKELEKSFSAFTGTIQWICESPFRRQHKRKNWYINFSILPEIEEYGFSQADVDIITTKGSGPGGQHKNKVETAVRAIHRPTGITALASEERSQLMNKKLAFARLHKRIDELNRNQKSEQKRDYWNIHNKIKRGNACAVFKGEKFIKV